MLGFIALSVILTLQGIPSIFLSIFICVTLILLSSVSVSVLVSVEYRKVGITLRINISLQGQWEFLVFREFLQILPISMSMSNDAYLLNGSCQILHSLFLPKWMIEDAKSEA